MYGAGTLFSFNKKIETDATLSCWLNGATFTSSWACHGQALFPVERLDLKNFSWHLLLKKYSKRRECQRLILYCSKGVNWFSDIWKQQLIFDTLLEAQGYLHRGFFKRLWDSSNSMLSATAYMLVQIFSCPNLQPFTSCIKLGPSIS